jgi:riboflavin kinase/FMN adenylyltransferase
LNKNLYGKKIRVNFIKKIRNEMKFNTPDDLSQQIKKDLEKAKDYFSKV